MAEFEISKNYELKSSTIAKGLKRKGINFVAIDFDKTLIAIHAGKPEWSGTVQDMIVSNSGFDCNIDPNMMVNPQDNVRPFFRCLIPQLLEQEIYIAIVTFSTRVAEIEQTLAAVYGDDAAEKIVIRGQDHKWMYVGNGSRCGKQMHMASAGASHLCNAALFYFLSNCIAYPCSCCHEEYIS